MAAKKRRSLPFNENVPKPAGKNGVPVSRRPVFGNLGNRLEKRTGAHKVLPKPVVKKVINNKVNLKPQPKPFSIKADEKKPISKKERAFSQKLIEQVEDIDKEDFHDPMLVSEYVKEIYTYMYELETKMPIKCNYLEGQEVTGKMRMVLVDWLVAVHGQFCLLSETLYMAVVLIDQYMQVSRNTTKNEYQLIGVTCLEIASKYEETYAPEIDDFAFITDDTYTKSEILEMEKRILHAVDFQLGRPLALHFLRRYSKAGKLEPRRYTLGKYLLELTLLDYDLCHQKPSLLAAAAVFLAINLIHEDCKEFSEKLWTPTLQFHSTYSYEMLRPVVKSILKLLFMNTTKFASIYMKYSSSKLFRVAHIIELNDSWVKKYAFDA